MTIADINSYVSFRANTNTTEYSAANRLISTNRWYEKVVSIILDSLDGWDFDDSNKTDYPIATTNLVANQQDYTLPSGLMKVKRVEITYDGVNWYRCVAMDLNERFGATDSTTVNSVFQTTKPFYDLDGFALKLYPIPTANVTAGLKIWYAREPAEFTSAEVTTGTKEPGFDKPFHLMIPLGICYDWFVAKKLWPEAQAVQSELADYEQRIRSQYGKKQTDDSYHFKSAFINYE